MTTNDPILDQPMDFSNGSGATITAEMMDYLRSAAKWGRFLAIVGFIFSGIMVLAGLGFSFLISTMGSYGSDSGVGIGPLAALSWGAGMGILYVVLGGIYFLPCWYQLRISNNLLQAIATDNEYNYTEAFRYQKALYRFFGIMMIVVLSIYPLVGILVALAAV